MALILVIEDNPTNLQLMVYLLLAFGHEPLEATDGEAGVDAVRGRRPDLVLCDVDLPRMDGFQVANALKLDFTLRNVPLVAVTALAMVGDRDRMLQAGFDGYISKPIQPRDFIAQVEEYLPQHLRGTRQPQPEPASQADAPDSLPRPVRARVLVVDDTLANLDLARGILEPHGFVVDVIRSAKAAIERARGQRPDIILSDVHMPGMDGFELLAACQADPDLRVIPFAFLSSTYYGGKDCQRALSQGASAFLQRPISPQALLAEVEALLAKLQAAGEEGENP